MAAPNPRRLRLLQQFLATLLVLVAAGLIAFLSTKHKFQQDWTASHRNSLTAASRQLLAAMHGPVRFSVFAYPDPDLRNELEMRLDRYRDAKPDINIDFIDPSRHPDVVKQYQIQQAGEVVVEYQGRHETLHGLEETDVTDVLARLSEGSTRKIVFLSGHGEPSIHAGTQSGIDQFVQLLHAKGLQVDELNLVKTPAIPADTSVLVVASPANALLAGEDKLITEWVQKGGNLLWMESLTDPVALPSLGALLGVSWENGYAAFAEWERFNTGNPALMLATDYPPNEVTQSFDQITVYPFVRPFSLRAPAGWEAKPLLRTNAQSWLQSDLKEQPATLHKGDRQGPFLFGVTLSRPLPNDSAPAPASSSAAAAAKPRTQRVVVLGNVDFLADENVRALGNHVLGINILQWLTYRDTQINIDVPKAPDANLFLPQWLKTVIGFGFGLMLPALLIGYGVARWARRRRR